MRPQNAFYDHAVIFARVSCGSLLGWQQPEQALPLRCREFLTAHAITLALLLGLVRDFENRP